MLEQFAISKIYGKINEFATQFLTKYGYNRQTKMVIMKQF